MEAPLPTVSSPRERRFRSRRGSTILAILMTAILLGVIATASLQNSVQETRLNEKHFLSVTAQNGVESVLDHGIAQLLGRWETQSSFSNDELAPSKRPLDYDDDQLLDFVTTTGIDPESVELIGGVVPPSSRFYVNEPFHRHNGKVVLARNVEIYAKATAASDHLGDHTSHAMVTFQLLDAPLFSHAIFYNMDLEFHPGPEMIINGPVHSNGNIWALAKNSLKFTDIVTSAADFRVSMMHKNYQGNWSSMPGESDQRGDKVFIQDADDVYRHPYSGSGALNYESSYYDSLQTNFSGTGSANWREYSSNTWDGNLQTVDHAVPQLKAVGYDDYVPDYNGTSTQPLENHAYALIEPNLPNDSPYNKAEAGEGQKFAQKAGMIVRVWEEDLSKRTGFDSDGDGTIDSYNYYDIHRKDGSGNPLQIPSNAIRLRRRPDPTDGYSSYSTQWYFYNLEKSDGDFSDGFWNAADPAPPNPRNFDTRYLVSFHYPQRVNDAEPNSDPVLVKDTNFTRTDPATGATITETSVEVVEVDVGIRPEVTSTFIDGEVPDVDALDAGDTAEIALTRMRMRAEFDQMFAAHPYLYENDSSHSEFKTGMDLNNDGMIGVNNTADDVGGVDPQGWADADKVLSSKQDYNLDGDKSDLPSGMIDRRIRSASTSESSLDLVEMNLGAFSLLAEETLDNPFDGYEFPDRYNGVVYVEMPTDPSWTPRAEDRVVKAVDNRALVLTEAGGPDADLQGIPDPAYNINTPNRDRGFFLATNAPIYVLGHFNADGTKHTDGNIYPDDPDNPNPPAALAGDAITILSPAYKFTASTGKPSASLTEFCGAIVCGLMPTNKGGNTVTSGGSHNFPRFLENWSSKDFIYRGSLVALFESEIQNQPWNTGYYDPPRRIWGFYDEFDKGNYPPGTPNVRDYLKTDFRFLTEEEYDSKIAALPWAP